MKIQAGEVNPVGMKMCKSCQTFGMIMMAGVKMEKVEGNAAQVTLTTSDDPALVARLQELAKRNTDEMAMMEGGGNSHN